MRNIIREAEITLIVRDKSSFLSDIMPTKFKVVKPRQAQQITIQTVETERGIREKTKKISSPQVNTHSTSARFQPNLPPIIETPGEDVYISESVEEQSFDAYEIHRDENGIWLEGIHRQYSRSGKVRSCDFCLFKKLTPFQSQTQYMQEWVHEKRNAFGERILALKAGPCQMRCQHCGFGKAVWRCLDCVSGRTLCVLCCCDLHQYQIFHRVERWNGRFYQKGALWQVGVKLYVGHRGDPCPSTIADKTKEIHLRKAVDDVLHNIPSNLDLQPQAILEGLLKAVDSEGSNFSDHEMLNKVANALSQTPDSLLMRLRASLQAAEHYADEVEAVSCAEAAIAETEGPTVLGNESTTQDLPLPENPDEEIWEDEAPEGQQKGPLPRILPRAPTSDTAGNLFLTLVDTSGFHKLLVVWCTCKGQHLDRDLQLLDLRLFPASFVDIKTVFSFRVLDDYWTNNLECKASAYQYHQKLKRTTSYAFPSLVPNRYAELRRLSRQWRNLKLRRHFAIRGNEDAKRGSMALFCAACPQPGVNLPDGWEKEQEKDP